MPSGYVRLWRPGHVLANADGYVLEHRLVLHDAGITVPAGRGFHVHHVNGNKQDNRVENLRVMAAGDHGRHHASERPRADIRHGTWGGYCNRGCRCDACRQAGADYRRERKAARQTL